MGILPIPRTLTIYVRVKSVGEYALFAWLVQQRLLHPLP